MDYTDLQSSANEMISDFGTQSATLVQRSSTGNTFVPATGQFTATSFDSTTISVVALSVSQSEYDDNLFSRKGLVISQMKKFLIPGSTSVSVLPGDTIQFANSKWEVVQGIEINPDGTTPVLYSVYVSRKGAIV